MSLPHDIHAHLADYAYTHITEDYIVYTENSVEECTHGLVHNVKAYPFNSTARYKDPVDGILNKECIQTSHGGTDYECLDLALKAPLSLSTEAVTMLRQTLPRLQNTKAAGDVYFVDYPTDESLLRPVSPPLRPREKQEEYSTILPQRWSDMSACTIIHVPSMDTPGPTVSLERSLNVLLPVTTAMVDMLRRMLVLTETMSSASVSELFEDAVKTPDVPFSDPRLSPPLFARHRHSMLEDTEALHMNLGGHNGLDGGDSDMVSNIDTIDLDEDNVRIVGGWRAFTPDSSFVLGSSPLVSAKTDSEIDFSLGSSSSTSGAARLSEIRDTFVIPRIRPTPGNLMSNTSIELSERLLGSIDFVSEPELGSFPFSYSPVDEDVSTCAIDYSTLGDGTLGNALGELGGDTDAVAQCIGSKRTLKAVDPYDIILEVGLDYDAYQLMEVPCLPRRSECRPNFQGHDDRWSGLESDPNMVPVRIKAVELQLTWSPHAHEQSFTDDELCGVDLDIRRSVKDFLRMNGTVPDKFERLLDMVEHGTRQTMHDPFMTDAPMNPITEPCAFDLLGTNMLLSRSETARILNPTSFRSPPPPMEDAITSSSGGAGIIHADARSVNTRAAQLLTQPASPLSSPSANAQLLEDDLHYYDSELHDWQPLSFDTNSKLVDDRAGEFIHQETCALEREDSSPSFESHAPSRPSRKTTEPPGIFSFLRLRMPNLLAATSANLALEDYLSSPEKLPAPAVSDHDQNTVAPVTLVDSNTLVLPGGTQFYPTTQHAYLATLTTVGKTVLVRHMEAPSTAVSLVEREQLDDVDLILDPHTAVLLVPMTSLPMEYSSIAKRLSSIAARFDHVLLLFECYPSSASYKVARRTSIPALNCFTPPIIKALRSLRRSIVISLSCEDSMVGTVIKFAFATSPLETARYIRLFGDQAEKREGTGSLVWADRSWLSNCEEEEAVLAVAETMNTFCAAVVLAGVSLEMFIEGMSPEMRSSHFGPLIGQKRMTHVNAQLAAREEQLYKMDEC